MDRRHTSARQPGQLLQGRYRIVRPLGRGGMASAWLVEDQLHRRTLALKLLDLPEPHGLERMQEEFSLLCGLEHPRLTRVHDFGSEKGPTGPMHFYTADFVEGATLDRFSVARTWDEILRPLCDALHALGFLHALGIRHGDFKPQNILVTTEGRGTLIDLGCAERLGESSSTLAGTPAYMAPELLTGEAADGRADLFSLGVTLEELFRRMAGSPSSELERLVRRLLRPLPRERPCDVGEVLEVLGDHEPVLEAPGGRTSRLVGRQSLWARLDSITAAWLDGRPGARALLLHGPSGVGKSRLLARWKWRVQLQATALEGSPSVPSPTEALLALASGRAELPEGVSGVLAALGELNRRGQPVALCLDDVDRLGDEDRGIWSALMRSLREDDRVLVLAASREPLELESPAAERLAVEPLSVEAVTEWMGERVAEERIGLAHRLTRGLPARVEALLSALQRGVVTEQDLAEDTGIEAERVGGAAARKAVALRLGPLDDAQREQLARLVALGGVIDVERTPQLAVPTALVRLSAAGWTRRERTTWHLAGAADLEELTAALGAPLMAGAHACVAEQLLEGLEGGAASEPADELRGRAAYHLTMAGRLDAAERLLVEHAPADRPGARRWAVAAEQLVRRSSRPEVIAEAARVQLVAGHSASALSSLARLIRHDPARRFDAGTCRLVGETYHALGRARRAARYLQRALAGCSVGEKHERASLTALLARVYLQQGAYEQAITAARSALSDGLPAALEASLRQSMGIAQSYLGQADQARAYLQQASELQASEGSGEDRMRSLSYLAIVEFRQGHLDAAVAGYRAAVEVAERHQLLPLLSSALLNLGTACQRQGAWGAALDHYERGQRLARALGRTSTEATLALNAANLYAEVGAFDRGLARLARVEPLARSAGLEHLDGMMAIIRGEVALARAEMDEAMRCYQRAHRFHEQRGQHREVVEAELHLAEAELARGDAAAAERHVVAAAVGAEQLDAADLLAQQQLVQARCAVARGEATRAEPLLARAFQLARQAAQPLLEAAIQAAWAAASQAQGRDEEAHQQRLAARRIWERVAEGLPPPLQDAFWRHPSRSELAPTAQPHFEPALAPTAFPTPHRAALARFLEVNQRINSTLAVERVLAFAMDAAIELTGADRGFVLLAAQEGSAQPYRVAVARNLDRQRLGEADLALSTSIAERVLETGEPLITVDAQRDERFRGHRSVHAMRLQSVAAVPIRSPRGMLGALYLDNRFQRGRFAPADLQLLLAFADQVAIALSNARMHAELSQRARTLEADKRAAEKLSRGQAKEIERLHREVDVRQRALELRYDYDQIVGRSAPMRAVLATVDRVVDSPLSVLVQGESGTGKELIARAIHYNSPRRDRPFVSINCAAMPEALLESELFGHVRGAFTGATSDQQGLMVSARGGTLLLDEVGDMAPSMQVKLLRALQEREVRPVGGTRLVPVDIRVLAATNRDLSTMVAEGSFREDLFYRVAVVVVELPPLRERPEDIHALARRILARLAQGEGVEPPALSPAALRMLMGYRWPGNVRQLENVLAKAYYLSDRSAIDAESIDLPQRLEAPRRARARHQFERELAGRIVDALHENRWNVSAVARQLGIPRNTLYRKLRRYQIERPT